MARHHHSARAPKEPLHIEAMFVAEVGTISYHYTTVYIIRNEVEPRLGTEYAST